MSGWCLQALGLCLGTAVTPGLLSIFVCWAMAPTQLCRSGRTLGGSMSSKISRRPWKPPGAETWDTACRGCKEGRSWGRGMVLLFLVSPPKLLEPGEVAVRCHSWRAHQPSPRTCYQTWGAGVSTRPHGSLWHPSATPCSHGPSSPFPSLEPQCQFSPTTPCPLHAPPLPALSLSQGLLPSLLPTRNKSLSKSSLSSQRKQLPTLSPPSHGTWLPPGCCEAFPRAQEVCSGKQSGTSGSGPSGLRLMSPPPACTCPSSDLDALPMRGVLRRESGFGSSAV